jgi:hypothetical protein
MSSTENLRNLSEDDVARAAVAAAVVLPISDSSDLLQVATAVLDLPVSPAEIETALRTAYVTLPLNTPADVLEAINRVLDVKLGDPGEGEGE